MGVQLQRLETYQIRLSYNIPHMFRTPKETGPSFSAKKNGATKCRTAAMAQDCEHQEL